MEYLKQVQNNTTILRHVSAPDRIIKIIESGNFDPSYGKDFTIDSDNGINCFTQDMEITPQGFGGTGAIMFFAWEGRIQQLVQSANTLEPIDTLLVDDTRAVIASGSNPDLSKIVGFEFTNIDSLKSYFKESVGVKPKGFFKRFNEAEFETEFEEWKTSIYKKLKCIIDNGKNLKIT